MTTDTGYYDVAQSDDPELTALWDSYARLPDPGHNDILDGFVAAKHITVGALVRLGTRLAQDHVLVYAFQGGLKYRDMQSGSRWATAGAEFPTLKIVRASIEPSSTVIVAEGETDGARLTLLYPDVDVAILPAGAKRFSPDFAEQLRTYDRVILGLDNDQAGEEGRTRIREHLPAALVLTPPDDWCTWPDDEPPPPLPTPDAANVGTLTFTDLGPAFRNELRDPELLVDDLPIYDEGLHALVGHPGAGKSIFTLGIGTLVMQDGRHVVWLDYEQGPRMTGARLRAIGTTDEAIAELFHYVWDPVKAEDQLAAIQARWPGALVVIDSVSKALRKAGIDENSAGEVTGWTMKLIAACKTYHMPIILVDHVSKLAKDQRYSRGSGAKLADVDVQLTLEVVHDFTKERIGMVRVRRQKDREASLPISQCYSIGDGLGLLPITPCDDPEYNAVGTPGV